MGETATRLEISHHDLPLLLEPLWCVFLSDGILETLGRGQPEAHYKHLAFELSSLLILYGEPFDRILDWRCPDARFAADTQNRCQDPEYATC